jgi:hypothetical protein
MACTAPCSIIAADTDSVDTRMAIRIMPPAMPRTPESTAVANTLIRSMAVNMARSLGQHIP